MLVNGARGEESAEQGAERRLIRDVGMFGDFPARCPFRQRAKQVEPLAIAGNDESRVVDDDAGQRHKLKARDVGG
jgi:hypothetical protein